MCGQRVTEAEMVEKTLSTFSPAMAILSQQYRNMKFKKHANLMTHLLLAEKHQQLLLCNAESRPVREVHTTTTTVHAAGVETYAAEASRRPPKGSYRKTYPSHPTRAMQAYGKRDAHKGYGRRDMNVRRDQPRPRNQPYKPRNDQTRQFQGNCHKCGRKGHFAKDCRAPPYLVNMYKELQQLRNQSCQTYNFENPQSLSNSEDLENYMTIFETHSLKPNEALLDSASTHTILTDPKIFHFR